MKHKPVRFLLIIFFSISTLTSFSQFRPKQIYWTADGNSILELKDGNIVKADIKNKAGNDFGDQSSVDSCRSTGAS